METTQYLFLNPTTTTVNINITGCAKWLKTCFSIVQFQILPPRERGVKKRKYKKAHDQIIIVR